MLGVKLAPAAALAESTSADESMLVGATGRFLVTRILGLLPTGRRNSLLDRMRDANGLTLSVDFNDQLSPP